MSSQSSYPASPVDRKRRVPHRVPRVKRLVSLDSRPIVRALIRDWRTVGLVVFSIALAIAANSTVVSLLEALIYPKMDMAAPDRLYWVDFYGDRHRRLSWGQRDSVLLRHSIAFDLGYWSRGIEPVVLENGKAFTAVTAVQSNPAFFKVASITPVQGRVLVREDSGAQPPRVLLSQRVASELFGVESPVGRSVTLQGKPNVVVGVLGDQADFPNIHAGVWSIVADPQRRMDRLVRVRDGFDRRNVEASLDSAADDVAAIVHERPRMDVSFLLKPAVQTQFHYERFHYAIAAACIALLIIACANAANLELSRAIGRRRQLAIRAALGASPAALIRQVLAEEALLAAIAALVALGATYVAARALYSVVPPSVGEFVVHPHVGWRVVVFTGVAASLATLLVGCAPAIRSAGADPQEALKEGAGTGLSHRRYYATLVAVELGLAITLSCGGIVMMRATTAFDRQPLGYDPAPLITGGLSMPKGGTGDRDVIDSLGRRLASVDGIASAAVTMTVQVRRNAVTVLDSTGAPREVPTPMVHYLIVGADYLQTLGVSLSRGPGFNVAMRDEGQVIVDTKTADRLWPGRDAVGQRIKLGDLPSRLPFARVVGVIAGAPDSSRRNVLGPSPAEHTVGGIYYLPVPGDAYTATIYKTRGFHFVARANGDVSRAALNLRRALIRVDNVAYTRVQLMDDELGITRAHASRRFLMQLFAFFALCGVALSGIAVFTIITRSVAERRRELSVRRALGAQTHQILRAVLRETVPVGLLGIALGLALTKYAIPLLGSQALPDDRFNAPLFGLTSVCVLGALCGWLIVPAMRAARVPTTDALRSL